LRPRSCPGDRWHAPQPRPVCSPAPTLRHPCVVATVPLASCLTLLVVRSSLRSPPFPEMLAGGEAAGSAEGKTILRTLQVLLLLVLFMGATRAAAAPPKDKEDASEVVTGTVKKLTTSVDNYEDGRVVTKHTALVKVETVERTTVDNGRVIRAGGTITVRWGRVTWPSRTTGHTYDVKEKAAIRAWPARQCGGEGFSVLDNAD